MNEIFDRSIRFFLLVLIFWLPYSTAVVEVCVIFSCVLWIIKRSLQLKTNPSVLTAFQLPATSLNQSIFWFIVISFISVFGAVYWEQSRHGFVSKLLEWFAVYFLVLESFTQRRHIRLALGILMLTAGATALDSFIQFYITGKDIFCGREIVLLSRATAGFKTGNGLSGFLLGCIPIAAFGFMDRELKKYRLLWRILLAGLVWSLAITFSRSAWISLAAAALISLFLLNKDNKFIKTGIIIFLIAVSVLFLYKYRMSRSLFGLETILWRGEIWQDTFKMIYDRPFFGHGFNTYMKMLEGYRPEIKWDPSYAHNCYLQIAAETGILGLMMFLSIFITFLKKGAHYIQTALPHQKVLENGIYVGILAFLIHSFFDNHFYTLQLTIFFWYCLGLFSAIMHRHLIDKNHV